MTSDVALARALLEIFIGQTNGEMCNDQKMKTGLHTLRQRH